MASSQQLVSAVSTDFTEFVIGVSDVSVDIGNADNGVLIQCEFLIGQIGKGRLQILLTLFALANQFTHERRQAFKAIAFKIRIIQIKLVHQPERCSAQRIHSTGTTLQFEAKACVALCQFNRTELKAARFEIQIPVTLLVRLIDPLKNTLQPGHDSGSSR